MARVAPAIAQLLARPEAERTIGPFRLLRQLGRGGFAPVWLASESYGGVELRTVAVKLFALDDGEAGVARSGDTASRGMKRERIVAEARALCQVEHPNVVRFFSIAEGDTGGVLGLAMEYVSGAGVDRRIADRGKLDVEEALAVGSAVASALAAVHENGLVHCDVKPANVIDAMGVFKLIDFGIVAGAQRPVARRRKRVAGATVPVASPVPSRPAPVVVDDLLLETPVSAAPTTGGTSGMSGSFAASGTTGYVDPACVLTGAVPTPSSDLYALGATLFECLAGKIPAVAAAQREGASGFKLEVLDGRERPPRVADLEPAVPAALARIVDALLEPDPARRPRSAEAVAWELDRVRRELAGKARPLPPEERGPFRGLGRFEQADRDVYFGRGSEIAAGLEMLRRRGLVALIGPSGSGKSSLARAGLLPAIADGELGAWPKQWDGAVAQPGEDPRASIAAALEPLVGEVSDVEPEALVVLLADAAAESGRGIVLLVDQLEELVTVSHGPSRTWAVSFLARLGAQAVPGVRAVVAARRDLLDELLAIDELGRVLTRSTLLVSPLSDLAWEDVLDHALDAYGYRLEDASMRRVLLEQLRGTSSAMPLVQFALARLWERRDTEKKIVPRAALEAVGGIGGALEAHADATLAALGEGAQEIARHLLLALTTAQGTRKAETAARLAALVPDPRTKEVIEALVAARLLTSEAEGLTVAHEALLTRWGALRRWVADAREDRLRAEEIEHEASAWLAEKRPPERLLKKRRLRAAEELDRRAPRALGEGARSFVRASRSAERRGFLLASAPVLVLVLAAAAFGALRWDAGRTKTSFCGATVRRWHVPECIAEVKPDDARHRGSVDRVTTRGGRVLKLEHLNGALVLDDDPDGHASEEYFYDETGKVREVDFRDRLGNARLREIYSDGLRRMERRDGSNVPIRLVQADLLTGERQTTEITAFHYEHDDNGFLRSERYLSTYDKPRSDRFGAFGYDFEVDARGLPTAQTALGADGKRMPTQAGFARIVRAYDAAGNCTEAAAFDAAGRPSQLHGGIQTARTTWDAYGNPVATLYLGVSGKPIAGPAGFAERKMTFDDAGDRTEVLFFDAAGAPVAPKAWGYAGLQQDYDARGNVIEERLLGVHHEPVVGKEGYARASLHYDAQDQLVRLDWLGLDGKPTSAPGAASETRRYDARRNLVEQAYAGLDGKPSVMNGCARRAKRYDARDDLLEDWCYGVDGLPKLGSDGYASAVFAYDEAGERRETSFFGVDGSPREVANGYARSKNVWDVGNLVDALYFGADGKPALVGGGFFLEESDYDERGNPTAHSFFGTDSKTPAIHWGWSRQKLEYDPGGRLVGESYFGTDGAPILAGQLDGKSLYKDGFARRVAAYDDRGNLTEERFFGVQGAPLTVRELLYARRAWEYDAQGNVTKVSYFAYNDEPTRSADLRVAGYRSAYDDHSREVRREYFDIDGKPAYVYGRGYASYTVTYDARGDELERAYFAPGGAAAAARLDDGTFARTTASYDDYGREIERAYYDTAGKLVAGKAGWARKTTRWDAAGHDVEEAYFGSDDRPAQSTDGYSRVERTVSARGDVTDEAYFGKDGKPTAGLHGYAAVHASFDERGHELERAWFGAAGQKVVLAEKGYARIVTTYDDAGNAIGEAYFGAKDEPVPSKSGAARVARTFEAGHPVDVRYLDAAGAPAAISGGYAHETATFDGAGRQMGAALFDVQDQPFAGEDGWASWAATFDPAGRETERRFFDAKHAPAAAKDGYARTTSRYDERGGLVEQWWFDAHDRPVAVKGAAHVTARFDEWYHEVERAWFGADGKPVLVDGEAREVHVFDLQGREIEKAYYGVNGELVSKAGWARRTFAYDAAGNTTVVAYFGADGKAARTKEGYARSESDFDERNDPVEDRYYDENGRLTKDQLGVVIARYEYDARGNVTRRSFLDAQRKPALSDEGIASFVTEVDDRGNRIAEHLFGVDGKPAPLKGAGWAGFDAKYDDFGHQTEIAYVGVDGKPVAILPDGFARRVTTYDDLGREIDVRFFGVDGELHARKDGIAEVRHAYDPAGHETERSFFGPGEKPAPNEDGVARAEMTYDTSGRIASLHNFDTAGHAVVSHASGCATIEWTYGEGGKDRRDCLDAAGKKLP